MKKFSKLVAALQIVFTIIFTLAFLLKYKDVLLFGEMFGIFTTGVAASLFFATKLD